MIAGEREPQRVIVVLTAVTPLPPEPPTEFTAELADDKVRLSWTASPKSRSYHIYRGEDAAGEAALLDTTIFTVYYDSTVESEHTYYYHVTAVNHIGESGPTERVPVVFFSGDMPVPATPENVTARTVSASAIFIEWDAVNVASRYVVYRRGSPSDAPVEIATPLEPEFTDESLEALTTYYYAVAARNIAGESPASALVAVTTLQPAPGPVTGVSAEGISESSISISWNGVEYAEWYVVCESYNAGEPNSRADTVTTPSCVVGGLTAQTTYTFLVTACNPSGCSEYSDAVTALTLDQAQQPPAAPAGVTVTAQSSSSLLVEWSAVTGASSYTVFRGLSADAVTTNIASITSTGHIDDGLESNTTYHYAVSASNSIGVSPLSEVVSGATSATLDSPDGLTVTAASATSAVVRWNEVGGATGYKVERATSSSGPFASRTGSAPVTATEFTDTDLNPGTSYYYRATAVNGPATSPYCDVVEFTMPVDAPLTPDNVSATAQTATEIKISFSPVSGATGYRIYWSASSSGDLERLAEIGAPPYTHTGLNAGATYYYTVSAVNPGGESAQSNRVSATTPQQATIHYYCVIDPDLCANCGSSCISQCPMGAIYTTTVNGKTVKQIDKSKCDAEGCLKCKNYCDNVKQKYAISENQETIQ
jgi:fibronectin type 3 domain-containing protein